MQNKVEELLRDNKKKNVLTNNYCNYNKKNLQKNKAISLAKILYY